MRDGLRRATGFHIGRTSPGTDAGATTISISRPTIAFRYRKIDEGVRCDQLLDENEGGDDRLWGAQTRSRLQDAAI
jgi:hypothetical protein